MPDRYGMELPTVVPLGVTERGPRQLMTVGLLFALTVGGTSNGEILRIRQEEIRDFNNATSTGDLTFSTDRSRAAPIVRPMSNSQVNLPQAVRRLHTDSGLTWEQLANLFGVSRRAIHNWVNGGNMTVRNVRILTELTRFLSELPAADAVSRRAILLLPGTTGPSPYERLRAKLSPSSNSISGTPYEPDQLIGALHE